MPSTNRTYVSIQYSNAQELYDVMSLIIPKTMLTPTESFHTTLMYSSDPFVEIEPMLNGKTIILDDAKFEIFGEHKDYLVLKFNNELIQNEFNRLKMVYGLNHSYPVLSPHITLVENYEDRGQLSSLVMPRLPDMIVSEEKSEILKDD